jgi:hypothetical protein
VFYESDKPMLNIVNPPPNTAPVQIKDFPNVSSEALVYKKLYPIAVPMMPKIA